MDTNTCAYTKIGDPFIDEYTVHDWYRPVDDRWQLHLLPLYIDLDVVSDTSRIQFKYKGQKLTINVDKLFELGVLDVEEKSEE